MKCSVKPTFKEFCRLAKKGNLVPIYAEILADLETPVSSFSKIGTDQYAYLLESVEGQEKIGRYSFLSSSPALVLKSKGRRIELIDFSGRKPRTKHFQTAADPLHEIRKILSRYQHVSVKGLPRFSGGFVGYMAYDMVRFFEKIPDKNKDDLKLPDSVVMLSTEVLIFDHIEHKIKVVANVFLKDKKPGTLERAYANGVATINRLSTRLSQPVTIGELQPPVKHTRTIRSNFKESEFVRIVNKAKEYIRKGDVIQVVLSQRFKTKARDSGISIYRRLRSINPSPYMYYLKFPNFNIIGSSPEMLVREERGQVETRPIAGTRPRGSTPAQDAALSKELLGDEKEKAEHLMLVDLGRNDLGRVCTKGSVKMKEFMNIEKYSHVLHIVSSVVGQLDKKHDGFDLLRSSFPAGTVSGAPKIRAMEIIDELENIRRGPYAGCICYFSFDGNLDTCITIRTVVIKDGVCYVQAGAGIVADSKPKKEYIETQNKAKALLEAIAPSR